MRKSLVTLTRDKGMYGSAATSNSPVYRHGRDVLLHGGDRELDAELAQAHSV